MRALTCSMLLLSLAGCGGGGTPGLAPPPAAALLGGTISGLGGSGLTLANDGARVSIPAQATTFAFPTAPSAGTAYKVSVAGQPDGQLCTVAGGAGTMGAAAAEPVTVTCRLAVVSTLAGNTLLAVHALNGPAASATFNRPERVATDSNGNVYLADTDSNMIRKISASGEVSTLAGSGERGAANGAAADASFNQPSGLALDAAGNVYVADRANNLIRKITPAGQVSTFAGSGARGFANGPALAASFDLPSDVAVDGDGNVLVADSFNNMIRKITPDGAVSTLAGSGRAGNASGPGNEAEFNGPKGIAVDSAGNVYVADTYNYLIRKVSPAGVVNTLAGNGQSGTDDGPGNVARFNFLADVALDRDGNVLVADGNRIRKIAPDGAVSTQVGANTYGYVDGPLATAALSAAGGVATDSAGNLIFTDSNAVRVIERSGMVSTLAGSGVRGSMAHDATGVAATFSVLAGVAVDRQGNSYVADSTNHMIRKITAAGVVSRVAGSGIAGANNGAAATATFNHPSGVAIDAAGNLYVADEGNELIRKITPAGAVSTYAGSGRHGAEDGPNDSASFFAPHGVALDGAGNLLVADGNGALRQIAASGGVRTLANSPAFGVTTGLNTVAVDGSDNTYFSAGDRILKISPAGEVSDLAGGTPYDRCLPQQSYWGTGVCRSGYGMPANGPGSIATFGGTLGLAADAAGNVFVADTYTGTIRTITPHGMVSTLAGTGQPFVQQQDGVGTQASFFRPRALALDSQGNLLVVQENGIVRKISFR